jgi:uncharacterized repeat protein (TIGR03843 family)
MATLDHDCLVEVLKHGVLQIEGQLSGASNATLRCSASLDGLPIPVTCVYKPVRGERPLWDFPSGTLGRREVAAGIIDAGLGWQVTPTTVWRDDGPLGAGMCQVWIEDDLQRPAVDVVAPDDLPPGWRVVVDAQTYSGDPVLLVHEDSLALQRIALFDLVVNNADRKGGHVLRASDGGLVGIDHGLTFHAEPKLRTVLWGWAGEAIPTDLLSDLRRLRQLLPQLRSSGSSDVTSLSGLLSRNEVLEMTERISRLLDEGCFPEPSDELPALPWPPM